MISKQSSGRMSDNTIVRMSEKVSAAVMSEVLVLSSMFLTGPPRSLLRALRDVFDTPHAQSETPPTRLRLLQPLPLSTSVRLMFARTCKTIDAQRLRAFAGRRTEEVDMSRRQWQVLPLCPPPSRARYCRSHLCGTARLIDDRMK